jgi:hypothetical protein
MASGFPHFSINEYGYCPHWTDSQIRVKVLLEGLKIIMKVEHQVDMLES